MSDARHNLWPVLLLAVMTISLSYIMLNCEQSSGKRGGIYVPQPTETEPTTDSVEPAEPTGALNVKLTVKDDAGIDRISEPVTSGIPIPQSMNLKSTSGLRIVKSDGKTGIPAQFSVLARWNGTPDNASKPIQWVLVDFQADVKSNRASTYYLKYGSGTSASAASPPIKVSEDKEAITVNTGPMQFRISKKNFNLFDGVWLDRNGDGKFSDSEAIVSPGQEDGGILTDTFDVQYSTRLGTKKVLVEENGPLRTVIKVEGRHKSDSDQGLAIGIYDYLVRIHAFAGKSFVKVHYTLKNSPPCPVKLSGFGSCDEPVFGSIAFKHFDLVTTLNLDSRKYRLFGEKKYEGGNDTVALYQDSSGGDKWDLYHKNWGYDIQVAHDKNPSPDIEGGPSFRGFKVYKVKEDWEEIGSGARAQGWVDVYDSRWGLTAQIRHFWQQCPKSIDIEENKLSLGLWPRHYNGVHWLDEGIHKTHEILYAFHLSNFNVEAMIKSFNSPLLATAPTKWYSDAKVIGPYGDLYVPKGGEIPNEFKLNRADIGSKHLVYTSRDPYNYWGWIPFGDFKPNPNGAGCPCIDPSTFSLYLQTFDRGLFDVAEESARQWMDTRSYHRDLVAVEEFKGEMPDRAPYWQGTHYQGWIPPDSSHLWFSNIYEYYLLTGNRKALESAHDLMRFGRHVGFWWHFTVDTQPFPYERAYGWLAYELTRMYEITGEMSYLNDAERLIKKAYDQADKRRGNLLNAYMYTPGTAGPGTYGNGPRRHYDYGARSWQVGIALLGVGKYADVVLNNNIPRTEFDGEDARDFVVGLSNLLAYEIFRPDVPIFPEDWFLTNPQPSSKELFPYGKYNALEFEIIGGLSIAYRLTGNRVYRDVINASLGKWNWDIFDAYNQTALANRNRQDTTPPSRITDLRAQKGGKPGEVILKWTAPGGNGNEGRASRYQIKYSEKPIVERIDCSKTENCYKPCEIGGLKTICPKEVGESTFWAATNVKGEPEPQPAGKAEQFTVKGLSPKKTYYFAMKTEDEAHNMSELSNLVKISP